MSSTIGNCKNCEKLIDCISNLEAQISSMQNSFHLVNNILQNFKDEYGLCIKTVESSIPETQTPNEEAIPTKRVLRKRKSSKIKREPLRSNEIETKQSNPSKFSDVLQSVCTDEAPQVIHILNHRCGY